MKAHVTALWLAWIMLLPTGSLLAQGSYVEDLTLAEMEQTVGGQSGWGCSFAPAMRPEARPGNGWSHECPPGDDSECMADGDWCIHKAARLGYQECTSEGASFWQQCWQCMFHCYFVIKYSPVEGSCNNGDPEQQCQGQLQGCRPEPSCGPAACRAGWGGSPCRCVPIGYGSPGRAIGASRMVGLALASPRPE